MPTHLPRQICSRPFGEDQLSTIRNILDESEDGTTRSEIARRVCDALEWRNKQGSLKEMGARVALLKLHRAGWINLPEPTHRNSNGKRTERLLHAPVPLPPDREIRCALHELGTVSLRRVVTRDESLLWDGIIDRYHYLGHAPLSGAQVRYLIESDKEGMLGAIGFGAAAFSLKARDQWIGWDQEQCNLRRDLVLNNRRFLILPWIQVPNLASFLLSKATQQVQRDFEDQYGYRPLLLETFVEQGRFNGGCYRAANWIAVGVTAGRGRNDRTRQKDRTRNGPPLPIKQVWLYPLHRKARQRLAAPIEMEVAA
jgi:hypothetical protein